MIPSGQLALIAAALFSGAAIYINVTEQPARLGLSDQTLLDEWKPAYKRGTLMQAPLAIISFLLGTTAWWQSGNLLWVAGGLLMLANLPVTLIVILPTNNRLMATQIATSESRKQIRKWGALYGVRTCLASLRLQHSCLRLSRPPVLVPDPSNIILP
jgi:hypothetical protein